MRWMAANMLQQHREKMVCHCRFKTQPRNRKGEKTGVIISTGYHQIMTIKWQLYLLKGSCPRNAASYCLLF